MRSQATQTVGGKVASNGNVVAGGPFTVRRASTGNYIVQFPGRRMISFNANPGDGVSVLAQCFNFGNGAGITVQTLNSGFAVVDASFIFTAVLAA